MGGCNSSSAGLDGGARPEVYEPPRAAVGASNGRVGLRNLGNTCFMNSALQCLCATVPLSDFFLSDHKGAFQWRSELSKGNPMGTGGAMAQAYAALIVKMWRGAGKSVTPSALKAALGKHAPQFRGAQQHDAQELLACLLDALHEDLNRAVRGSRRPQLRAEPDDDAAVDDPRPDEVKAAEAWRNHLRVNKSIIVDLFQGQLRSTLTCSRCDFRSLKFDPFMYLSLPLPRRRSVRLEDCLRLFCEEEELEWRCPRCKSTGAARKRFDVWKLPPVLIVHLKRFEHTRRGRGKLTTDVQFPLQNLNLAPLVASPQRDEPVYDLFAVTDHHGGIGGGHYTASVRHRYTDRWMLCNDSSVRDVPDDGVQSSAAYVLFYSKMVQSPGVRRQSVTLPHLWPHMLPNIGSGAGGGGGAGAGASLERIDSAGEGDLGGDVGEAKDAL